MKLYARKSDIVTFISQTKGKFFSVKFLKRTTGKMREMTCRTGVKCHLSMNPKPRNWLKSGLIGVFDVQTQGYRSIPIEGIRSIKINGDWVYTLEEA